MADKERAERSMSLGDAVLEAEQACVEYAAVGDALGYPGVRGRESLVEAVRELARWLRGIAERDPANRV